MEKEMYYDEDRNLILITNENYKRYLGLDVECVLCISSGAQGAFGTAEFWTSDGKGYGCSYLNNIEWDNLIKVVPVLENTVEGYLLDGNEVAEGWVRKEVIGFGYFLFVKVGLESKYGADQSPFPPEQRRRHYRIIVF